MNTRLFIVILLLCLSCISPSKAQNFEQSEIDCLAEALYFEARGEPLYGKVMVADVILTRKEYPYYPDTICGVVRHNKYPGKLHTCQFSYYCDGKPEVFNDKRALKEVQIIAEWMIEERGNYTSSGSMYYHSIRVLPSWSKSHKLEKIGKVGEHIFYKRKVHLAFKK